MTTRLKCPTLEVVQAAAAQVERTGEYSDLQELQELLQRFVEHHLAELEEPLLSVEVRIGLGGEDVDERRLRDVAQLSCDLLKLLHYKPLLSAAKLLRSVHKHLGEKKEAAEMGLKISHIESRFGSPAY